MPKKHKKPVGLVQRNARTAAASSGIHKASKPKHSNNVAKKHHRPFTKQDVENHKQSHWNCQSEIDRQAASCVGKLLAADASKRGGASIKALTLALHINAKKAVHAVTCQTLQCE